MIKEGFTKKLVLELDLENDGLKIVREMDLSDANCAEAHLVNSTWFPKARIKAIKGDPWSCRRKDWRSQWKADQGEL